MKFKLKDIADITMGQSPKGKSYNNKKDGKAFLQGRKTFGRMYPTIDTWTTEPKKIAKSGSVLMSVRAPVGDINIANDEICIGRGLCSINAKNGNNKYLYYLLLNNKANIIRKSSGTVFDSINKEQLEETILNVHKDKEQSKIVSVLNTIDEKIELNTQTNDNLYELANQLYQKAFSKDKSIKWKKYNLTDIANINTGYSYKSSELVENSTTGMATIKNFERTGGFKVDGFKPLNPSKKKSSQYVNKFDVLVACTDLTQNADIIGNAVLLLSKGNYENIVISMDLVKVTSKVNYIDNFMIYAILNSKEFKNYAIGYTSGTTVLHLNKNCFKEFTIKLPEKNIIQNFIKEIKPIYLKISQTMEENRKLEQLRDTLLPKLMNGEIDLDKIEI